jgi:hypothetical protein
MLAKALRYPEWRTHHLPDQLRDVMDAKQWHEILDKLDYKPDGTHKHEEDSIILAFGICNDPVTTTKDKRNSLMPGT